MDAEHRSTEGKRRKRVANARSRAVAGAVSALAFLGIGAAIGARAANTSGTVAEPTTGSTGTTTAPVVIAEEDDEGGTTWAATPGTTLGPGSTATAPTTTSGGSVVPR